MPNTTDESSFWSGLKYLIGTASDVYGKTLDAKVTQKANEASANIAQAQASKKIKIGNYEIDVTQAAIIGGGAALILLLVVLLRR